MIMLLQNVEYLGNIVNDGYGVCTGYCPSDKPVYTERTNSLGATFKLCCKDSGCTTGVGDCYDAMRNMNPSSLNNYFCNAAFQ
jgi:hypothetical protein